MRKIYSSIAALLFCTGLLAQKAGQEYIDSMLALLPAAKDDTNKTKLIYRIGDAYNSIDPEKGMMYAQMGLEHARKLKFDKGIASFYISIGNILSDKGMYDSAIGYFTQAYTIDDRIGYQRGAVSALINIGAAEQRRSRDAVAISYLSRALPVAEDLHDDYLLGIIYNNISDIYFSQENMAKAKEFADRGLTIARRSGSERSIASALLNLGNIALVSGDTVAGKKALTEALELYQRGGDQQGKATILSSLGSAQGRDVRAAIYYRLLAKEVWDSIAPAFPVAITNTGNLGMDYLGLARRAPLTKAETDANIPALRAALLEKASTYLRSAIDLSQETGDMDNYSYFLASLADLQEFNGDFHDALTNYRRSVTIRDSLYSQENKNHIAEEASRREIETRDQQLQLNQVRLTAGRRQRMALWVGVGLVTLIGVLLFWQSQVRKRANRKLQELNHQLEEANQFKARFFAIISHDLRSPVSNLVHFLHLQRDEPGLLTAEKAAQHEARITASAESLLESMESMLLWSKSQMEQFRPQEKKITLSDLFDTMRPSFDVNSSVILQVEPVGDLQLWTDPDYLRSIIVNITSNAFAALAAQPGGWVRWSAYETDAQLTIEIADNGPGIQPEQLRILNDGDATIGSKSGFGLHLVRDLARAIGCAIRVESAAGGGTRFFLQFLKSR